MHPPSRLCPVKTQFPLQTTCSVWHVVSFLGPIHRRRDYGFSIIISSWTLYFSPRTMLGRLHCSTFPSVRCCCCLAVVLCFPVSDTDPLSLPLGYKQRTSDDSFEFCLRPRKDTPEALTSFRDWPRNKQGNQNKQRSVHQPLLPRWLYIMCLWWTSHWMPYSPKLLSFWGGNVGPEWVTSENEGWMERAVTPWQCHCQGQSDSASCRLTSDCVVCLCLCVCVCV